MGSSFLFWGGRYFLLPAPGTRRARHPAAPPGLGGGVGGAGTQDRVNGIHLELVAFALLIGQFGLLQRFADPDGLGGQLFTGAIAVAHLVGAGHVLGSLQAHLAIGGLLDGLRLAFSLCLAIVAVRVL